MADETTENLEQQIALNQALNDVLSERARIIGEQTGAMGEQTNLASSLREMIGSLGETGDDAGDGMGNLAGALEDAMGGAGDAAEGMGGLGAALLDSKGAAIGFGAVMAKLGFDRMAEKAKAAGKALWDGLLGPINMIITVAKTIAGVFTGAMKLVSKAAKQARERGVMLSEAWEDVKKSVSTVGPNFDAVSEALKNTGQAGASASQLFGTGPAGMANGIKETGKMVGELGIHFTKLKDDFVKNVDAYIVANKALGISAEGLTKMSLMAQHEGRELSEVLAEQARMTVHLADTFDVDAKHIGKNIDDMTKDFGTFGGLSQKELAATAAYAAKLGVEVKALQGLVGKTDDFESAAEAASGLAQSFGMNIDTMELMTADPAEKMDMLRDSFKETGQSFMDMSRQEKQRMADLSGMDVGDLASALNPDAADVDFSSMEDAAAAAADGAISQEEANYRLAKSIDKITDKLEHLNNADGALSAFTAGISKALMNSPELLEILSAFNKSLQVIFKAGMAVGSMFANELGPGGSLEFVGNLLKDIFDPKMWQKKMDGIVGSFKEFFATLKDPTKAVDALGNLITNLLDNIFGGQKGVESMGVRIKDFIFKAFDTGLGLIIGAIPVLLINGVKFITEFLESMTERMKDKSDDTADGVKESMFPMIEQGISKLIDALGEIDWMRLVNAFLNFVITSFKEHPGIMITILGYMFGGPAIGLAFTAIQGLALAGMKKGIKGLMKGGEKVVGRLGKTGMGKKLAEIGADVGPKISGNLGKAAKFLSRAAGPVALITAVAGVGLSVSKLQEEQGARMGEEFGEAAASAGMLGAGVIDALTMGLLPDDFVVKMADFFAGIQKAIWDGMDAIGLGALVEMSKNSIKLITDLFGGIGDILRGIFSGDKDMVTKGAKKILGSLLDFLKDLPGQIAKLAVSIVKGVATLVQKIAIWLLTDGLKMLINGVTNLVKSVGGALLDGFMAVVNVFLNPVESAKMALDWGLGMLSGIWEAISGLPGFFLDLMTDAWDAIAGYWGFASPATKMIELGQGLIDGVLSILGSLPEKVKDIAVKAWNALTSAFSGIKEFAGNIITGFMQKFREIKDKIKDTIKAALGKVGRFLGISSPSKKMAEVGDNMGAGMVKGFSNVGEQMALEAKEALAKVAMVMVKGALEIGQIFARGITAAVGMIAGAMQSVAMTLLSTFKLVFQSMVTLAQQNIMMILMTVKSAFEMIASIIMNSGVLQAIEQVFTTFRSIFTGLADMVVEQITRVIQTVKMGFEMMTSILVSAREIIVGNVSAIFGAFTGIFTGITEIATTNIMKVVEVVYHGFKRMFQVFNMARDFILDSMEGIGKSMVRIFKFSINSVVDIIAGGINTAINTLKKATTLIGDVMGVIKGMAEFGTYFAAIGSTINIFGPDPKDAADNLKGFEQTFDQMTKTQMALFKLESTLNRSKDVEENVAEKIATIVDAYNDGAAALSNIAPINIDAVLSQVNDSLRVRRDKITIEDNGVTINMSLNVTMMAEDVAKPLIESDLVLRGSSEKVAGLGVNT